MKMTIASISPGEKNKNSKEKKKMNSSGVLKQVPDNTEIKIVFFPLQLLVFLAQYK